MEAPKEYIRPPRHLAGLRRLSYQRHACVDRVARVQLGVEPRRQMEAPKEYIRPPRHLAGLRRLSYKRHAHAEQEAESDQRVEDGAVPQGRPGEESGLGVDGACGL